jgi:hypothetical protein
MILERAKWSDWLDTSNAMPRALEARRRGRSPSSGFTEAPAQAASACVRIEP